LDYSEDKVSAEDEIQRCFAQDAPAPAIDYGIGYRVTPPFYPNIPQVIP
jgi:hypothetical protein